MDGRQATGRLHRLRVVFTGRLASMSRRDVSQLVAAEAGSVQDRVSRRTDLVVIGSDGWPLRRGGELTENLRRADRLQATGAAIEVITEDAFLRRLGYREDLSVRRLHTLEQLSRMIGVSGLRLRRWVHQGLLQPVEPSSTILEFDYAEVSTAKMLAPLLADSRRRIKIVDSLERLRRWLPEDRRLADHLIRLKRQVAIRDDEGRLIDSSGQYLIRFDEPDETVCAAPPQPTAAVSTRVRTQVGERLFRAAYRRHCRGEAAAAVKLYRRWMRRYAGAAPRRQAATVLFNLGNAYRDLSNEDRAIKAYQRSVRRDAANPHAFNNLGLALAACDRLAEAVAPLRKALELDPDYCEACYNLADVLDELEQFNESRLIWLRYLAGRDCGDRREYAARRLAELSATSPTHG